MLKTLRVRLSTEFLDNMVMQDDDVETLWGAETPVSPSSGRFGPDEDLSMFKQKDIGPIVLTWSGL